jgi:hypothetical protein
MTLTGAKGREARALLGLDARPACQRREGQHGEYRKGCARRRADG